MCSFSCLAVVGDSLREVLDSGIREDMHKTMLVLAKRSTGGRSSQAKGVPKVADLKSVDGTVDENVVPVEIEPVGDDVQDRRGKRVRDDGDEGSSRRVSSRQVGDPPRPGVGKSLVIIGMNRETLPPVLQNCSSDKSLHIEINPNERWTAGSRFPIQVFKAFDLPQDMGSYIDKSRDEIADRCLARGGRVSV